MYEELKVLILLNHLRYVGLILVSITYLVLVLIELERSCDELIIVEGKRNGKKKEVKTNNKNSVPKFNLIAYVL